MSKQETISQEEQDLLQLGLDSDQVQGLKNSQQDYKKMGVEMSLMRIAEFELGDSLLQSQEETSTEGQLPQEAQSYLERLEKVRPELEMLMDEYWS